MLRSTLPAIPLWVAAAFLLAACGRSDTAATPAGDAPAEAASDDAPNAVPTGAAEPVELDRSGGYKAEQVRLAMRGIAYEGDRLSIDPEAARTIVDGPDAEASAEALAEGRRLISLNRRNEALALMTRAVLWAPESAAAYEGLGDALTARRKFAEAGAAFRAGLERAPNSASLHHKLGDNLVRLNQREEAIGEFRRALALDPDHPKARERLALQLYYTGRPAAAWVEVHRSEARGQLVPPQFRILLAEAHPEPAGAPIPSGPTGQNEEE